MSVEVVEYAIEMLKKRDLEIQKLKIDNKLLMECVVFYSLEDDWNFYCGCCVDGSTKLEQDHGKRARECLAKLGER